jgi:integrase
MGKRGNGEGSIGRRKDGLYMARYTVHTATGPKRKALYGKTRQEVAAKLSKALADRERLDVRRRQRNGGGIPGSMAQ